MTLTFHYKDGKEITGPFILLKQNSTEKEFLAFANEDVDCELIDGVLVIHSPANNEHEDIFSYLMTIFRLFLDATGRGQVRGSRFVMRLSDKWSPGPDILVITPEKYTNIKESRLEGPADLVVEILSESTREIDLEKKLPKFLTSGVQEVWIIDPKEHVISIHYNNGESLKYDDPSSTITITSNVLPELQLAVRWIWNREQYPTSHVIKKILP